MKEQHTTRPESRKTISIIVPVYKTERFLSACIASILAQTFTDFELILVDDGSPDGCPALCDAAAAKDSRIRVIHQKNRGLSGARNAGLDAAEGEWIAFVDSDDMLLPQALEKAHSTAEKTGADVVLYGFAFTDENGNVGYLTFKLKIKEVFVPSMRVDGLTDGRKATVLKRCLSSVCKDTYVDDEAVGEEVEVRAPARF